MIEAFTYTKWNNSIQFNSISTFPYPEETFSNEKHFLNQLLTFEVKVSAKLSMMPTKYAVD